MNEQNEHERETTKPADYPEVEVRDPRITDFHDLLAHYIEDGEPLNRWSKADIADFIDWLHTECGIPKTEAKKRVNAEIASLSKSTKRDIPLEAQCNLNAAYDPTIADDRHRKGEKQTDIIAPLWDAATGPIFIAILKNGAAYKDRTAIRSLGIGDLWLMRNSDKGWAVMSSEKASKMLCVPINHYIPCEEDEDGNVILV